MALHVIVGAGPVGTHTARLLVAGGHDVTVVTRSGSGPEGQRIARRRLDAADASALTDACDGAVALYNCANPPYHRWPQEWPPLANAMLEAARRTGAVLVTTSNLYAYGPVDGPMRESTPLAAPGHKGRVRARMWADALAAHEAGHVRATEARAGDYFGPMVTDSALGERVVPRLLQGKRVRVLGDPGAPHSWTYVPDVAATLVRLATDPRAWGRAWHVPSAPACSAREMVEALCRAAGVPPVKLGTVPAAALRIGGLFVPVLRELRETAYQFERPFVMDSTAAETELRLACTPLADAAAATVAWYRDRSGATASAAGRAVGVAPAR